MPALSIEQVLGEELEAVLRASKGAPSRASDGAPEERQSPARRAEDVAAVGVAGTQREAEPSDKACDVYSALYAESPAALCLSGGGIRSAAFALGVIQALAAHSGNATKDKPVADAQDHKDSLLSQFHYLSTVSGGGYIGSWLSAWISRVGYEWVWRHLTGRAPPGLVESPGVSWLRAYSNFITPRLGLMSADTWTVAALFVRNMLLNWLVIIPSLCALLIVVKGIALGIKAMFEADHDPTIYRALSVSIHEFTLPFFVAGFAALIFGLRYSLANSPTRFNSEAYRSPAEQFSTEDREALQRDMPRQRQERGKNRDLAPGCAESGFLLNSLLPVAFAALVLVLWISGRYDDIAKMTLAKTLLAAGIAGFLAYALAWLIAQPWRNEEKRGLVHALDLLAWSVAGAVCGVVVGLGVRALSAAEIGGHAVIVLMVAGVPWVIAAHLLGEMIFVGLTSRQTSSDQDREWFGRSTGWFAATSLGWLALTSLVVVGPMLAAYAFANFAVWGKAATAAVPVVSGLASTLLGHSGATPANDKGGGRLAISLNIVLAIAVPVFLGCVVIALSAGIDWALFREWLFSLKDDHENRPRVGEQRWGPLAIGLAVAVAVGGLASLVVNVNWFSLHSLYRNRLIRAFLGASNVLRRPNPFTGFDQQDNPQVAELWPADIQDWARKQQGRPPPALKGWRPFHVINVALNLVSSRRLAWQERKAASFTISPLHSGAALDGQFPMFRRTFEYGWPPKPKGDQSTSASSSGASAEEPDYAKSGISLGTAMAISGAAASPNMGYHSSPLVTLVLALFNIRLGWWLGNPHDVEGGDEESRAGLSSKVTRPCHQRESPRFALAPLLFEVFGKTSEERAFVYLSDGGHFENLGLYEMVRRRCRHVVVSDAGCDPDFAYEDLGNAIRKISIDLGVAIRFDGIHSLKRVAQSDKDCRKSGADTPTIKVEPDELLYATAEIEYPAHKEDKEAEPQKGYLLYVKPVYHTALIRNVGVRSYAIGNPDFPHESTGDQFFSESQFESYRALAYELMERILGFAAASPPRAEEQAETTPLGRSIRTLHRIAKERGKAKREAAAEARAPATPIPQTAAGVFRPPAGGEGA